MLYTKCDNCLQEQHWRSSNSLESNVLLHYYLLHWNKVRHYFTEQIGCYFHYILESLKSLHWHNIYGKISFVVFCLEFMPEISE